MTRTHRASFLPPSSAGIPDRYLTALVLFDELAVRVRSSVEGLSSADRLGGGDRSGQYRLDLVADADVVDSLLAAGYNVLSEESGFHDQGASLTVVVDPVDGSTNASRGLPWWASSFSLVAEVDGALTPVASLVADHGSGAVFSCMSSIGGSNRGAERPLPNQPGMGPDAHIWGTRVGPVLRGRGSFGWIRGRRGRQPCAMGLSRRVVGG